MERPSTAREALIAEAIGDLARLIDRVDALGPAMDRARKAMTDANGALVARVDALEGRMAAISSHAEMKILEQVVRRTNEAATRSIEVQTRAMTEAARALFAAEVGPTLQRLTASLHAVVARAERLRTHWWTHAATAAVSAVASGGLAIWLLHR